MVIDVNGNGSMLFQSLDPADGCMYTWAQDESNAFVQVTNIAVNGQVNANIFDCFTVLANDVDTIRLSMGGSTSDIAVIPGLISNSTLFSNATNYDSYVGFNPGVVADSTNSVYIHTPSVFQKNVAAGAWAPGNNAGGMGQGLTAANNTWYHTYAIRFANGFCDAYFDTSNTAANAPANTAFFRRLGSIQTAPQVGINAIPFVQFDDYFMWTANSTIIGGSAAADLAGITPGVYPGHLYTLNSPPGIPCMAHLSWYSQTASTYGMINSPLQGNINPNLSGFYNIGYVSSTMGAIEVLTDQFAQIRVSGVGGPTFYISTHAWRDFRGRT